jgi:anti-sigma regulatory factor (Ser/Thr protein kinase)
LELGAYDTAVPCARLHTRQVLWEWSLREIAETAELVVSEIFTNAVRASGGLDQAQDLTGAGGVPTVRLWLHADRQKVMMQVWDGNDCPLQPREPGLEAEGGRGLLLVEALSTEWGSFTPAGWQGKVVWAVIRAELQPMQHSAVSDESGDL